ncbi:MAG TPA: ATP-binding cassette domain-containing protein [Polyangiaceae bacterium]|nr:ATP-binding cassette domain-containing protein [Polyangiaceae bacterium]
MIRIDQVEKAYAGRRVLGPVTLEIASGQRVALVGPSGCGKSTLLRVVIGLLAPDRGTVTVSGTPMGAGTKRALRRKIGYVIQDGGLFPHLTGEHNVTLMARELGWDAERIAARVKELGAMTGLGAEALVRWPAQLSGGQRQRVGIMRALMLDPEVLLLDEPLGALDAITRARLQAELATLFESLGKTVVLVTHDIAEAARLADESIVLRDGEVVQRGRVEDMARAPADPFVAELLTRGMGT